MSDSKDNSCMTKALLHKTLGLKSPVLYSSISSGISIIDNLIGDSYSGYPRRKITHLTGSDESIDQVLLNTLLSVQRSGGKVVFIDSLRCFNVKMASDLGLLLNTPSFMYVTPEDPEGCLKAVYIAASTGVDLVVWFKIDSSLTQDTSGGSGHSRYPLGERLSQVLKWLARPAKANHNHGTALLITGRSSRDVDTGSYKDRNLAALGYHSSVTLHFEHLSSCRTQARVLRNKLGFTQGAEFDLWFKGNLFNHAEPTEGGTSSESVPVSDDEDLVSALNLAATPDFVGG